MSKITESSKTFLLLLLLTITSFVTGWLQTDYIWVSICCFAFVGFLAFKIYRACQKPVADLHKLLDAIKYDDFSFQFSEKQVQPPLKPLYEKFNTLLTSFRQTRMQGEEHRLFLQHMVQHIGIPLIAFAEDGKIELINAAAKRLWGISYLRQLADLDEHAPGWTSHLLNIKQEANLVLVRNGQTKQLAAFATEFILSGKKLKLVSLADISRALDSHELEAWSQLLKVLTHEIMNSITPISSLAATTHETLRSSPEFIDPQLILPALEAIERRSKGLNQFVQTYRELTTFPKPVYDYISVNELFTRIKCLTEPSLQKENIGLKIEVEPVTLQITADPSMIEQAILNLIKNAEEALSGVPFPEIMLAAKMDDNGQVWISVSDNGAGILPDIHDQVFVPFFSTKKTGSGIGLSIVKRIMQAHKGQALLSVSSGQGAVFNLIFG